jgi:hypothetical protein
MLSGLVYWIEVVRAQRCFVPRMLRSATLAKRSFVGGVMRC